MFRLLVVLVLIAEVAVLAFLSTVASNAVVLLAATGVPLTLVVLLVYQSRRQGTSYRVWRVTPERIVDYRPQGEPQSTPEVLSKSIVERAAEIRRAMLDKPSEVQVEMCALGYRACVDDMITLTHLVNDELPNTGFVRRMRLNKVRRRAADALNAARQALPPGALRATHQEQQ
jgi:hypothetical protein